MRKLTVGILIFLAVLIGGAARADEKDKHGDSQTTHSFQLAVTSSITSDMQGVKHVADTETTLCYTLRRKGREATLTFDEIRLKAKGDGRELQDDAVSRAKYKEKSQGKTREIALEDAPDELKKMLQDSFGVPVCKLLLDEHGKELKRTVVARPGAKFLIEGGQIANGRLFHPPFLPDRDKWQETREVSMGGPNVYARGVLTYEKKATKTGRTTVKVSGTLTNDRAKPEGLPFAYKNARYEVSGEQTYDAARQEWVAGNLLFQLSFQVETEGRPVKTVKGTMRLKLELLPASPSVHEKPASLAEDLASARKGFVTKLRVRGPAPQHYQNRKAPPGVNEVEYTSGHLTLKGWLSADAGDGKKRPAVVFLHGGWAFDSSDWKDAEPFAKAGFVLFMPMLRGENGNPGNYESFFGEVDDAIAAGRFVASLPNVDGKNVFVAGHSVGGVLTCLVAMLPSPYKAAAALDGWVEIESWAAGSPDAQVPYDRNDRQEVRVRNPMAFVASIRCPLRLYAGDAARQVNAQLAAKAKQAGKDCELVVVRGGHQAMVTPAVQQAIAWFRQQSAK